MPTNKNELPLINADRKPNAKSAIANDKTSSRVKLLDIRGCTEFISQLKSLLMETKNDPPVEVEPSEVERRVCLLNEALEQVTERYHYLLLEQEKEEKERLAQTNARRLQEQETLEKKRQVADKHREEQVHEMREQQVVYYTGRNEMVREKAAHCLSHNAQTQVDTVVRAAANEERRKHNLALLAKQKKELQQSIRHRHQERLNAARIANARREAQREQRNAERFAKAQEHEEEMKNKLAALRETRSKSTVLRKQALQAKLEHAQHRNESIDEEAQKQHDKLTRELEEKQRQQQIRYAEENADRLQYLEQRSQYRVMRQEIQQQKLLEVIDGRLQRGSEVLQTVVNKQAVADDSKRKRAEEIVKHNVKHQRDVIAHRRRAEQQEKIRCNAELSRVYAKWNTRAARILTDLNEAAENSLQSATTSKLPNITGVPHKENTASGTASSYDAQQEQQHKLHFASPKNFTVYETETDTKANSN